MEGVERQPLRVVCGPTAAGKSSLVMRLAAHVPLAVVSADSRQIYRGFDLGTAKPSPAERRLVPHYGIDVADPTERYSAARWAEDATRGIASAEAGGRTPVVVGGTGFYVRALVEPLFDEPELDPEQRAALSRELDALDIAELRSRVEQVDPARAHLGRAQLLRALEVAVLTGMPISRWHQRATRPPRYDPRFLVIDPGPALAGRIEQRVDTMLAEGWEREVRQLQRCVPEDAPAWNATGYGAIREMVRGELAPARTRERVVTSTRQYAKRQRTWIRHQLPADRVTRLTGLEPDALDRALLWWRTEVA